MEDLRVLQAAEAIADRMWERASQWPELARDTVGRQAIRAADSIGANIAEAFGRFHFGEKLQFLYYARGSLFETKYWVNRAARRALLDDEEHHAEGEQLTLLAKQLNQYAGSLKAQRRGDHPSDGSLKEQGEAYLPTQPPPLITDVQLLWLQSTATTDDPPS